jgi:putative transposase
MRKRRFREEQIIGILQEVDAGGGIGDVCRRHGIAETTYYRWRKKYGDMGVDEARRLKQVEEENRRLKRIVADQALNLQILKDLLGNGS